MDESTHLNSPENQTEELGGHQDATQRGASQSEFTQMAAPRAGGFSPDNLAPQTPTPSPLPAQPLWTPPPAPPAPYMAPPPYTAPRASWVLPTIALGAFALTILLGFTGSVILRSILSARPAGAVSEPTLDPTLIASTPLPTFVDATPIGVNIEPWNGTERFTMLVMGIDKRPNETGTAFRTDSMILVSLDPKTKSVGILSIPRDLFVNIPPDTVVGNSYGLQRINSAYTIGELVKPGYGPQLAMQTVQYNLGMRVNDYVVFDFQAVIDGINSIDGIDVDVTTPISDPMYPSMNYGYEPLYIPTGNIHMDGDLALKFARTRHGNSDIERGKRQQQVVMAIRQKILDKNMIPELLLRAPTIWSNLSRHMRSGLSLDQLLRLALYAKDIPLSSIRQGVIDYSYVTPTMWNGAAVLIPNRPAIGPLLVNVFGPNYNQR